MGFLPEEGTILLGVFLSVCSINEGERSSCKISSDIGGGLLDFLGLGISDNEGLSDWTSGRSLFILVGSLILSFSNRSIFSLSNSSFTSNDEEVIPALKSDLCESL